MDGSMPIRHTVILVLLLVAPLFGATIYSDRATFLAAVPTPIVENFEAATITSGTVVSIPSPLDALTNNAVFASGSIVSGLQLTGSTGFDVSSDFFSNNTSVAVFLRNSGAEMTIRFLNGASAVGLDFYSNFSEGPTSPVTAFDAQGGLIATQNLDLTSNGVFFGIASNTPIAQLNFRLLNTGGTFGVDNIAFVEAASVPEPSSGLLIFSTLLALSVTLKLKRPKAIHERIAVRSEQKP